MKHKISFETNELIIIRECVHKITLRGSDAMVVGNLLSKIQRGIDKAKTDNTTGATETIEGAESPD